MSAGRLASAAASRVSRLSPSPTAARAPTSPRTARSSAASSPFIGFFPDTPRILYLPGVNLCLAPFYKDERIARAVPVSRRDSSRRRRSIVDRSIVAATRKQSPSPLASRSRAPSLSPSVSPSVSPSLSVSPSRAIFQFKTRCRSIARADERAYRWCVRARDVHQGRSRRRARPSRSSSLRRPSRWIDVFLLLLGLLRLIPSSQTQHHPTARVAVRGMVVVLVVEHVETRDARARTRVRAHVDGDGGGGVLDAKGAQHRRRRRVTESRRAMGAGVFPPRARRFGFKFKREGEKGREPRRGGVRWMDGRGPRRGGE